MNSLTNNRRATAKRSTSNTAQLKTMKIKQPEQCDLARPPLNELMSLLLGSSGMRNTVDQRWLLAPVVSMAVLGSANVITGTAAFAESTEPAYSMTIKTYGEGNPSGDNLSEEGLQQNRRVDVTIETAGEQNPGPQQESAGRGVIWSTTDPANLTRQLELTVPSSVEVVDGNLVKPLNLHIFSNYMAFVDRWEVVVFNGDDFRHEKPLVTMSGNTFEQENRFEWSGKLDFGKTLRQGEDYLLVLRAYDSKNRIDETFPTTLSTKGPERNIELEETPSLDQIALLNRQQRSELSRQEIVIQGARVRVYGRDLGAVRSASVNGEAVTLDEDDQFVAEYLLPEGEHEFDVQVKLDDNSTYSRALSTKIDGRYFFATALADITVGENSVSGNIETLDVDETGYYGGDMFIDGRLAFYLKGKVKGKYLVTAQMDTGHEDIDELFDNLQRKDTESIFRRLDPDQYYPVYGDDSTLIDDTDSQGKLYVRVDWDHSRGLWGNFNTGVTGNELSQFNRSLYGFQLKRRSKSFAANGEHRTDINLFVSEAQSAHRHNEFRATGGSLYYLRDQDIVRGSEKIWVEVRSRETSRTLERIELVAGKDYQIDDYQGRIILNRPLLAIDSQQAPSIIKDQPLDGNQVWLVADYEYVPDDFDADEITFGGRIRQWLTDSFAIGGTWVQESRDGDEHIVQGLDATVRLDSNAWIRAEFSHSESAQTAGSFTSDDGGLQFSEFFTTANPQNDNSGYAVSVTAGADFREWFGFKSETNIEGWYKFRESGFSAAGFDTNHDTADTGIEASKHFGEDFRISARGTYIERAEQNWRATAGAQAEYDITNRLSVAAEFRQIEEQDEISGDGGAGSIGALQAGFDVTNNLNLYTAVQATLDNSGTYESNDLLTIGVKSRRSGKLGVNAEASTGDRGDSLVAGVDYKFSNDYSVYANNEISTDDTNNHRRTATIGQRRQLSDKTRVYTEHQFSDDDTRSGLGHTFGLDYKFNQYADASLSFQIADYETDSGEEIERDALSLGVGYKRGRTSGSSKLEFRRDISASTDTNQWVATNNLNYVQTASLRWQGRFNHSYTRNNNNDSTEARFTEAGIGFALRPVKHDRLNMLGRLTGLYDLPPTSQSDRTDERSVVGSLEAAYQINRLWEVGGKFAYKQAELRAQRDSGDWNSNNTTLAAARLRYHLVFRWDALAEYHWLHSENSDDTEHGTLLAIGRNVGDHLNLSVGYNFTAFDDNLLNDDADVQGWFVNLVGKY